MSDVRCPCCDYDLDDCECEDRWGPGGKNRELSTPPMSKQYENPCICGGFAWRMNGRPEHDPHMEWCPQREEYLARYHEREHRLWRELAQAVSDLLAIAETPEQRDEYAYAAEWTHAIQRVRRALDKVPAREDNPDE